MTEELEAVAAGRLWAVHRAPYLATALFAMSPVMVEGLSTMATDRYWRLYIDPVVLKSWTTEEVGAVLIHEAHHLIRSHAERAGQLGVAAAEHERFNVAADFEINDDLRDLPLPLGRLDPEEFGFSSGDLAENYFMLLESTEVHVEFACGSGAHGVHQDWDQDVDDASRVDPFESELIRQQVARDISAAAQSIGTVPGGLERWARAFLRPKIDWRRELGTRIRSGIDVVSGAVDYSYRRPSRRVGSPIGRDVIFPALVQPIPRIAVVVDNSASMSEASLTRALAEINGILRSSGVGRTRLTVMSCDTAVRASQSIFAAAQVRLRGGGGTDMSVGIEAAAALRPKPELVVIVTDGYTPWPSQPKNIQVVVALIGEGPKPPNWAQVVRIPAKGDDVT
jgi:predicted metal-dependent peptidase